MKRFWYVIGMFFVLFIVGCQASDIDNDTNNTRDATNGENTLNNDNDHDLDDDDLSEPLNHFEIIPRFDEEADITIEMDYVETSQYTITAFHYYSNDDFDTIVEFYKNYVYTQGFEITHEALEETRYTVNFNDLPYRLVIAIRETSMFDPGGYLWRVAYNVYEDN